MARMGAEWMVIGDDTVPSKERHVIEQPVVPAVVTAAVDPANRVG
jgi:hypothetical protein